MKVSGKLQAILDKGVLDRLPVTFGAYCSDQLRDWALLFPAEQSYFERLFALLDTMELSHRERLFTPIVEAEKLMGVNDRTWPRGQFTLDQVDFLNRNPQYPAWRKAVASLFAEIDPILEREVAAKGRPRLVVVLGPAELPAGADRLWLKIADHGVRINVTAPEDPAEFARALLAPKGKPIGAEYAEHFGRPYDAWSIECGERLAQLDASDAAVRISYQHLETYRKRLMVEVNQVLRSENIPGPRQLSARLKQMKLLPAESGLAADPVLAEFTRSALLSGNGTLLINNTFVEWTTMQAVRRARPSVMTIGFGIRNKVKPFTSLLIYADQETSSPIPSQMDTLGSYVDLEIFYQYVWQEFQKYAEYRNNTVFLFACEGVDQILIIAPSDFPLKASEAPASLAAVHGHLRDWLQL